jgi:hypothetical protein
LRDGGCRTRTARGREVGVEANERSGARVCGRERGRGWEDPIAFGKEDWRGRLQKARGGFGGARVSMEGPGWARGWAAGWAGARPGR